MKTKILSDLAEIRFGINTRTSHGNIPCVQGKDFDDFGQLQTSGLSYISEDQCKDIDFLQPGDVLFAAKGTRNYAVCWSGQLPKAVASSIFFVVRVKDDKVLPDYLTWFLMTSEAARHFERDIKTATVRTISKKVFAELRVPLRKVSMQHKIVKLYQLFQSEQRLIDKLTEMKNKMIFNL